MSITGTNQAPQNGFFFDDLAVMQNIAGCWKSIDQRCNIADAADLIEFTGARQLFAQESRDRRRAEP